ncbi:MAG: hypothetical protein IPH77_20875 [Ignavibacteria bacterium]|nr:hypothetical protein [Ignavibacteria bacterium]
MSSDILLGNLDSYNVCSGENFYVYFPSNTNLMSWIIWGYGIELLATRSPSNIESLPVTYMECDKRDLCFQK